MRRASLVLAAAGAAAMVALPAQAVAKKPPTRTRTAVHMSSPAPANAVVAGFKLRLMRAPKARGASAVVARAAAGLPRHVTVYAVVAKQKRSDRVSGVLVAANRSAAVSSRARRASRRKVTVNLSHGAVPRRFSVRLKLSQSDDVIGRHRSFSCSRFFRKSDLASARRVAGPALPGVGARTLVQSACNSAKSFGTLYPAEGAFLAALNARSGAMALAAAPVPNEVNGTASFNYPVKAFAVLTGKGHQFTACGVAGGTCAAASKHSQNDYVQFTLPAAVPAGAPLAFALGVAPSIAPRLPFEFFGIDQAGRRSGPLLTTGP